MRVAFFSPLPPEPTGIGDYSFELLEKLCELVDVTAVVADNRLRAAQAPAGVRVLGASSVRAADFDAAVYQMGNNPKYHRFVFHNALEQPGLLVMHDPSLADYLAELCGSAESSIFRDEVAYDNPAIGVHDELPLVDVGDGTKNLDRLRVLLARRIVTASVRTLVNSDAMAAEMRLRYPGNEIHAIPLPGRVIDSSEPRVSGPIRFGVFGGINYYKRIRPTVDAFMELRRSHPGARMVVAGRADDRLLTAEIRQIAAREELQGALEVKTELTLDELEREMTACDVAISLRWPTAGEMSATLMRCLGAGRPAVVSDVLQFRELDDRYCWRVPVGPPEAEAAALLSIMERAANDPDHCREVGVLARRFVENEANYEIVARRYVEHLEACIPGLPSARAANLRRTLDRTRPVGVNVTTLDRGAESLEYAHRLTDALTSAGVDVVEVQISSAALPDPSSDEWHLDLDLFEPKAGDAKSTGTPSFHRESSDSDRAGSRSGDPASSELGRNDTTPDVASDMLDDLQRIGSTGAGSRIGLGPHDLDLFVVGESEVDQISFLARHARRRDHGYVVVTAPSWVPLPIEYSLMAADATEVWVPSESAAVAIRVGSRAPVLPLPPLLSEISEITPSAERVGCSFVVHVDGRESFARQNPWASIAAFRAAFPRNERGRNARLVVVTRHLDGRSEGGKRLRYELDRVSGELLDVAEFREVREEISRGDVFVSLHRSEGFATHILDAMAIGRPVVATAFLGVVDFLDGTNGCPVGYSMREADAGDYYLDPCGPTRARRGECWAEANVDQAARWMRKMLSSPVLRRSLGTRAALTVRELAHADANLLERVRETTRRHLALRERVRNEKVENRRRLDALYSSNGLVTAEPPLR